MKRIAITAFCTFLLLLWTGIPAAAQASSTSTQTTTTTRTTTKKSAAAAGKLDINSASKEEMETLPGIGPATSQKIIDNRPYTAKSDLLKRKIVSSGEYQKIKTKIVAHHAGTAK